MLFSDDPEAVNQFIDDHGGGWEAPGTFTALGSKRGDKIVGGVTWSDYNGAHCTCNIALLPEYNHRWLLVAVLNYSFIQLKLRRLTFIVKSSNIASLTFVRHFGATLEATLRGADPSGDLLIFALWPENCPLWNRYYGKKEGQGPQSA